jgi:hypothetical protein
LAYARTDIGGAYRLNSDDSWTPLLDFANDSTWNYWGVDALATDPVDTSRLYLATGMYTNSWDPNNGYVDITTLNMANLNILLKANPHLFGQGRDLHGLEAAFQSRRQYARSWSR